MRAEARAAMARGAALGAWRHLGYDAIGEQVGGEGGRRRMLDGNGLRAADAHAALDRRRAAEPGGRQRTGGNDPRRRRGARRRDDSRLVRGGLTPRRPREDGHGQTLTAGTELLSRRA